MAAVPLVRIGLSKRGCARSEKSHSRTVPSRLPPASMRPPGPNATETARNLPVARVWPSDRTCAGSATSHSTTVPSRLPLASLRPLGLNATESIADEPISIADELPVRIRLSKRGCAGSAISHSRTVPSKLPLASVRRSGLNATDEILPPPPVRIGPIRRGRAESATSHSRIAPSSMLASVRPSGLNATE